jgi:serine/threonine protein kinase
MDSSNFVAPPPLDPHLAKKLSRNLPTPFAIAVRRLGNTEIQPSASLNRQLALLDGLLRCWFFLLDIERRALGLPPRNETKKLFDQLYKPTLGMWRAAAEETAQLNAGQRRLLPGLGACFLEEGPRSAWLSATQKRNEVAHSQGLALLPDRQAQEVLADLQPSLLHLLEHTGELAIHPLFSIEGVGEMSQDKVTFHLRTYLGREPRQVCHLCDQLKPHKGVPLLLTPDGTVLHLSPWFKIRETESGGDPTLFLFRQQDHSQTWAQYDRPDLGAGAKPLQEDSFKTDFPARKAAEGYVAELHKALQPDNPIEGNSNRLPANQLPAHLKVVRGIGEGGSGIAYLVRGPDNTESVFKVLHPTFNADGEQAERLAREAHVLASLEHPGVIRVLGLLPTPSGGRGLWLPFIDGPNLTEHITKRGPLPPAEAIGLIRQVLEAVGHVHARGVLHRDIKPSNILLRPTGEPVLIDFGLARQPDAAPLTETGALLGTWSFAAPEIQGRQRPSVRSDLYSVGRVLEFLLTADQNSATWRQSCAPGIQRLLRKALHPNPDHRFADAATFLRALAWADDPAPFAWGAGDTLPGGIRITRRLDTGFPPFAILRGTALDGSEAAALITEASLGARARLYALHQSAPPDLRAHLGCLHVQVTEDGHPFLTLRPDMDMHGVALLHSAQTWSNPSPERQSVPPPANPSEDLPKEPPPPTSSKPPRPETPPPKPTEDVPPPPPEPTEHAPPPAGETDPRRPPPPPKPTAEQRNLENGLTMLGLIAAGALVGNAVAQGASGTKSATKPRGLAALVGNVIRGMNGQTTSPSLETAHRLSLYYYAVVTSPPPTPELWLRLHQTRCLAVLTLQHLIAPLEARHPFVESWQTTSASGELVRLAQRAPQGLGRTESDRLLELLKTVFVEARKVGWTPTNNELARIADKQFQIRTADARSGWLEV